jgi:HPt (histidine-containing phosphotransfer) domain-containing protein
MPSDADPREQTSPLPDAPSTPQSPVPSSASRVWAQFHGVIFERMATIETAVAALRQAQLTDEIRKKAVLEAHRLAGSLGMFGLAEGTRLAREIETTLGDQAPVGPEALGGLTAAAAALRKILEMGPA